MDSPKAGRVAIVSSSLETVDRLQDAVAAIGLEPIPLFSAGEAVGGLRSQRVEAVVLDVGVEESDALRGWLDRHFRGVVVLVSELEGTAGAAEDEQEAPDPDAVEVAVRLLRALNPAAK